MIDAQEQSRRGLLWLGSAAVVARALDVAATLVVVGLLSREQMGLAALVLSACAVLEGLSGIGVGSALVQIKDVSKAEESSLFWFASAIGLGLGALLALGGPVLAVFYAEPRLGPLSAASGLKLLFIGVSVVPHQLLSKDLRFKESGAAQTIASFAEGSTKIALALAGTGAWALVAGNVARGVALVAAVWVLGNFRPRLHFSLGETRRFTRFGLHVAGSSLLFHIYKNVDYFLVGKFLGLEPLGLYRVAFDVAMQPTDAINVVMGRVGFPVYSRLSDQLGALRAAFVSNTRSLFLLVIPVAVFVFFAASEVLALIGSGRWAAAVPAVQVLVVAGMVRAATVIFPQVYVAVGRPGLATLEAAITLVTLSAAICVGLFAFPELGVLSVCYAWLFIYPLILAGHLLVSRELIGLKPTSYLRALGSALGPMVALAVALSLLKRSAAPVGSPWMTLILIAVASIAVHWAYLRWVLGVRWRDIMPKRAARASAAQTVP